MKDERLLHSCTITRTLPCLADPMEIRVIAEVSEEIQEVFPYLNAVLKGCMYNHPAHTLTIRKDQKLITLRALHSTFGKIKDESEAEECLNSVERLYIFCTLSSYHPSYSEVFLGK